MKMLKQAIAVAVAAMAVTGAAEAKIAAYNENVEFTGSELVFDVWNKTTNQSYALDLGVLQSQFRADSTSTRSWTINDANFSNFWGAGAVGNNVVYNITSGAAALTTSTTLVASGLNAGLTKKAASILNYGLYTTLNSVHTLADFQASLNTKAKIDAAIATGGVAGHVTAVNTGTGESAGLVSTNASMYADQATDAGYTGSFYGSDINAKLGALSNVAAVGSDMNFYRVGLVAGSTSQLEYAELAKWNFSVNANGVGTLVYNAAPVSQVPLPAAVWMFGAGLMGMLRLNRRKSAAV